MMRVISAFSPARSTARGAARRRWGGLLLAAFGVLLVGCGSSAASTAQSYTYKSTGSSNGSAGAPAATSAAGAGQPSLPNGTPANTYLIRSLSINLQVSTPLVAEQQVSKDVLAMDPQAQASGEKISQDGAGNYVASLTFAVTAPKYDAVKAYLHQFAQTYPALKGKLVSEEESVENVTAQYVDLQSRLTNLRTEQQRLLQLLSQAQSLSDTLAIQDKLTEVEGQIEQIEGQINQLAGQTSYSMVTITLSAIPAAPASNASGQSPWNPGQVLGSAFGALVDVLQVLVTVLIWVLVFSPLWGPPLVFYLWRRAKLERARRAARVGIGAASASGSGVVAP